MPKKYLIILFFAAYVGARHAVPLHAQAPQEDPCPEGCMQEDTFLLETWYPSPWNEYEELKLYPKWEYSSCDSLSDNRGLIFYDNNNTLAGSDDKLMLCKGDQGWQELGGGGFWTDSGTNIYNANSGNVGIGTANPQYKLTVEGSIASSEGNIIYNCSGTLSLSYSSSCTIVGRLLNTQTLMGAAHTSKQCTDGGGAVTTAGGQQVCKFSGSSCPGGWTKYSNWSTTSATTCVTQNNPCGCPNNSCTTGSHSVISDTPAETCSFISNFTAGLGWCNGCGWHTCTATVTAVACY